MLLVARFHRRPGQAKTLSYDYADLGHKMGLSTVIVPPTHSLFSQGAAKYMVIIWSALSTQYHKHYTIRYSMYLDKTHRQRHNLLVDLFYKDSHRQYRACNSQIKSLGDLVKPTLSLPLLR